MERTDREQATLQAYKEAAWQTAVGQGTDARGADVVLGVVLQALQDEAEALGLELDSGDRADAKRDTRPRCGLYVRVSTPDQHPSNQVRQLLEAVQARGWRLNMKDVFLDFGEKGADFTRPGLLAMRKRVHAKRDKLHAVVIWDPTRLGRLSNGLLSLFAEFDDAGVGLVCAQGMPETLCLSKDEAGDWSKVLIVQMIRGFAAAFAEADSKRLGARIREGIHRKRQQHRDTRHGNAHTSPSPAVLTRIEALALETDRSWQSIIDEVNEDLKGELPKVRGVERPYKRSTAARHGRLHRRARLKRQGPGATRDWCDGLSDEDFDEVERIAG